jgi:hypothetical protein
MLDDDEVINPAPDPAVADKSAPEVAETEPAAEGEQPEVVAEEDEELEWDGTKFRLAKSLAGKLKPALMMQADYTRKTQEVAEAKRALEAQQVSWQQQARVQQEAMDDRVRLKTVTDRLAQYDAINWPQAFAQDQQAAQIALAEQAQLQGQRTALTDKVRSAEQAFALQSQQDFAKRLQDSRAEVARTVSNWSPEVESKLAAYGQTFGFSPQELQAIATDPRSVRVLHAAMIGSQLIAKQTAPRPAPAVGQPVAPPPAIQPLSIKVSAGRPQAAQGPSDRQSLDAWMESRNKQARVGR